MSESLKQQSMRGIIWSFLNRSSIQVVQFVVSLVLARLLCPEDYGVVGLAYIAMALVGCFSNLGLGGAIVQKKEADDLDYCTFFWADAAMRLTVYAVIFFAAPAFARYYAKPEMTAILRVIATGSLISLPTTVSGIILTRRMDFKTTAWIGVVSCLVSGGAALVCAFSGFGVWALVVQNILGEAVSMPLVLWRVPWRPHFRFSRERFGQFFNFGYKLLLSGILDTFYNNVTGLIIGKAFSVQALGFYSKGDHLPSMAMNAVNAPINGVSFPMLSKLQDDPGKYRAALRKALRTSIFFVAPIMTGLVVVAKPLILLLYGEKWLPAVPFLQIMAVCYIFYPVHTLNLSAIIGLGRTDWFLKLEIAKKIWGVGIMFAFIPLGLMFFVCSKLLSTFISILINTFPLKRLIGYSTWQQIRDISQSLLGSLALFAVLFPLNFLPCNPFLIMSMQIPLGIVLYLFFSWLTDRETLCDNSKMLKNIFFRR